MAEVQDLEVDEVGELEAVSEKIKEQQSAAEPETPKQDTEDEVIPEKYRGKSVKDLIEIAEHANKSMGRYANELGEVRKLADELIKSQLVQKPKEQEVQPEVDFFENPQEAVRRAVEANPRVQAAEQYAILARQEMAKQKLAQLHPDFAQVTQSDDFATWVKGSKIRTQLFKQADSFDIDAANELLSTFKELRAVKQSKVSETEKISRDKTMTAAAVDTGGSGESSKKIYRRADLMRLMQRDRPRYEEMQDEIMLAYREGRVK